MNGSIIQLPSAGLPEAWDQGEGDQRFRQTAFDQGGHLPPVVQGVHLVKGLFSDTLPPFLQLQAGHNCP